MRGAEVEHPARARVLEQGDGLFAPPEAGGEVSPGEDHAPRAHGLLKDRLLCSDLATESH